MLTIFALYVAAVARVVHSASGPLPGSQGMALRGPVDQVNVRTGDDLSLTERFAGPHVGFLAHSAGGEAPMLNEHGVVLRDFGGNAFADLQFAAQAPVPARSLGAAVGATKATSTTITTIAAAGVEAQTSDEPGVILPYVDGHSRAYFQIASEAQAASRGLSAAAESKFSLGASVAVLSIFLVTLLVLSKLCGDCAEAKFGCVGDQPEETTEADIESATSAGQTEGDQSEVSQIFIEPGLADGALRNNTPSGGEKRPGLTKSDLHQTWESLPGVPHCNDEECSDVSCVLVAQDQPLPEAPATCAVAGSVLEESFSEDVDGDGQMPRDTLEAECHEVVPKQAAVATHGAEPPFTSAHFIEDEKAKSGNTLGDPGSADMPEQTLQEDLEEEWC